MDNKTKNTDQENDFCSVDVSVYACFVFIVFTKGIMQTAAHFKLPVKSVHNGICMP